MTDHVDVHVMKSKLHGSPKPGGPERKRFKEAALDLFFIIGNGIEFFPFRLIQCRTVQPVLVLFLIRSPHLELLLHKEFLLPPLWTQAHTDLRRCH